MNYMNAGNGKRLSLDTNILVYSLEKDSGLKHEVASEIVDQAIYYDCVLTLQSLSEFYSAATGKDKMSKTDAEAQIHDWMELFPVVRAGPATLLKAVKAVRLDMLSFWDAMIWATVKEAKVKQLISEDFQNGRELEGVTFINPFELDDPIRILFGRIRSNND